MIASKGKIAKGGEWQRSVNTQLGNRADPTGRRGLQGGEEIKSRLRTVYKRIVGGNKWVRSLLSL